MSNDDDGFNSKNWVWVPGTEKDTFIKGFVSDYLEDGTVTVTVPQGSNSNNHELTINVPLDSLENCNPVKFNKCEDMAELTHLNEPSVVYNLYLRYADDMIYTYSGLFLVAINPYKKLDIYDGKNLKKYHSNDNDKPPPHIFSIAENTYRNMLNNKKDQSILVTGESGAGKTENTKRIIQYISSITTTELQSHHSKTQNNIDTKILQANPILESFGNAKTIKNHNSSRFGKFIKIYFSNEDIGCINGATIDYYLLEKSRVVMQSPQERNYHVFYQMLKGLSDEKLTAVGLEKNLKLYKYLNSSTYEIPNVDDATEFQLLLDAFRIMGFEDHEVDNIIAVLAVILLLGNLDFTSWKSEQANFTSESPTVHIARLLGISEDEFTSRLLRPKVKAGREFVSKSMKAPDVKYSVDAFAKHLYERIFQYIIERINDNLKIKDLNGNIFLNDLNFIGVLDIAGFEIFDINSFEQLCINYTNEKLQQFFNHHLFILEQSEYLREDIQWEFIDFGLDLQPTIDLIESRNPMGLLKLLDEECIIPKSSDQSFMDKLADNWGRKQSEKFTLNKLKSGFIVNHYAGQVEYNVDGWLQKNTDPISEQVVSLLPDSSNIFLADLFSSDPALPKSEISESCSPRKKASSNKLRTASQRHREQLVDLMDQLGSTEPHFVRCILPNLQKKPHKFDKPLVLNQLRCNGVLEGIRITRAGYPNRMTFEEFYNRYYIISAKEVFTKNMRTNSEIIIKGLNLEPETYRVGITKLFFKNGILGKLEEIRDQSLKNIFTELQTKIRGNSARLNFNRMIKEIQSSQLIARTFDQVHSSLETSPWLKLFINIKPLLEESVKVLDTKEMNENIKQLSSKLKDAEKLKEKLVTENDRIKEEFKEVEVKLQDEKENLKKQILIVEEDAVKISNLLIEKEKALDQLKQELQSRFITVSNLEKELGESKVLRINLANEMKLVQSKHESLASELASKEKEVSELQEKYNHSQKEIAEAKEKLTQLESSNSNLEGKIHDLESQKSESEHVIKTESIRIRELTDLLEKETDKNKKLVSEHANSNKEIETLKLTVSKNSSLATSSEAELITLKNSLRDSKAELSKVQLGLERANDRIQRLERKLQDSNEDAERERSASLNFKRDALALQSKIDELESKEAKLIREKDLETLKLKELSRLREALEESKREVIMYKDEKELIAMSLSQLKTENETLSMALKEAMKNKESISASFEDLKNECESLNKLKNENATAILQLQDTVSDLKSLKSENDSLKNSKEQYSREVKALTEKVNSMEPVTKVRGMLFDKENQPPISIVEEYASMKLKLNEHTAALRKEKFENKQLAEEIALLKSRADNDFQLSRSRSVLPNKRSMNGSTRAYTKEEFESLKFKLEQEELNAQRAESYAIDLQKKLNKLQSLRGINQFSDYEKKYNEAQIRISELENRFSEILNSNSLLEPSTPVSLTASSRSNSFRRNSVMLPGSNQEFALIYQDITRALKATRSELGDSKSEILRLKSLLRESEDELYEIKHSQFRTSVSNYDDELAQLKVRNETLFSRNEDLTESLAIYKKRSEEYFSKLEQAEAVVNSSKAKQQAAEKELENANNQLLLKREELRASNMLLQDFKKRSALLEGTINDKNYENQKLGVQIKELKDRLNFATTSNDVHDNIREEMRQLNKELNFKMQVETNLIKENKKYQLELEDLIRNKKALEEEFAEVSEKADELEEHTEELTNQVRNLQEERAINERKIVNLNKQVDNLKDLIEEISNQRDNLRDQKSQIEEQLLQTKHQLDEVTTQLNNSKAENTILRDHLQNQREDANEIRSELSRSKSGKEGDIQDYQKLKRENLVTVEENDSLKKVNEELNHKVHALEEKLYGDETMKFWENKVKSLTKDLDASEASMHESNKSVANLTREIAELKIRVNNEQQLAKKYNNENFEFQNQIQQYKTQVGILQNKSLEHELLLKQASREKMDLELTVLMMEKELLELRERLHNTQGN
ncbi:uncharacterized protein KQ657_000156 [Scheffersomyces spartinae]|uniref:Myosin motor domain-containing protein n=1 Tax=Scheffersomyces spartinae TaxID=45513 RepID=A0A9P8ALJ1_9ASCO|nr:uncharacterized protein KQ657_000156 [Scheffersomyces spartinae]KAG7196144.1 hypothetical protein KQ657_000156 [Scheffersomyces spartinae]